MGEPVTALTLSQVRLGLLVVPSRAGGGAEESGVWGGRSPAACVTPRGGSFPVWRHGHLEREPRGEGEGTLASLPGVSLG